MKKGFTLIELLIVTVVIVTLMGVVFRLAGLGDDSRAETVTLARLQRIENALSGYYAAYGSYPPVRLHGSRSIYAEVDSHGIQNPDNDNGGATTITDSGATYPNNNEIEKQIEAACRSQPFGVLFPLNAKSDRIKRYLAVLQQNSGSGASGYRAIDGNVGGFDMEQSSWQRIQLFKFGVLSFLMPRYSFMLEGVPELYDEGSRPRTRGQWAANNHIPCRMDTGNRYGSWEEIQKAIRAGDHYQSGGGGISAMMITNLASQAVCARWMPNFEGIVSCGVGGVRTLFGVNLTDTELYFHALYRSPQPIFGRGGYNSNSDPYMLDGMTVCDGWGTEFFYYSEPPYQSYRLWSAGPDGKTFPPWFDLNTLGAKEAEIARKWMEDDLVQMRK